MSREAEQPRWTCSTSWRGCQLIVKDGYWKILRGPTVNPIESLLSEIEKALKADLLYLALLLTLTLPDICAAVEQPDGRTSSRRYKTWYKANVFDKIGGLSPEEAYELRCTVVHQGQAASSSERVYNRVIFSMRQSAIRFDSLIMNGAMVFDVEMFCDRWIGAIRTWLSTAQHEATVSLNSSQLLQVRPFGWAPYAIGIPIIA